MTTETERERVLRLAMAAGFNVTKNPPPIYPSIEAPFYAVLAFSKLIELTRAEALEEAASATWQPIETAPKDFCTEFDASNGEDRFTNVSWAHPDYSPKGYFAWCVSEYDSQGQMNVEVKGLTHWMPLPPKPKKSEQERISNEL